MIVDAVMTKCVRDTANTFHARVIAITDDEHFASGQLQQFRRDRAITAAERDDDADVLNDARAVRQLESGQRVLAAFKNENDVLPVMLDDIIESA
jgi:hypothetical protein